MNWEVVMAVAEVGAAFFALVGLVLVWLQLKHLVRDSHITAAAAKSSMYTSVSDAMMRVNGVFAEYPRIRKYFYENVEPPSMEWEPMRMVDGMAAYDLHIRLDNTCEIICDFADDLIEQHRSLRDGADWSTWWAYLRFLYQSSPKLRAFMAENVEFYPDYFHERFGHIIVRDRTGSALVSRWSCYEVGSEESPYGTDAARLSESAGIDLTFKAYGYPWFKTWYFVREPGEDGAGNTPAAVAVVEPAVDAPGRDVTRAQIQFVAGEGASEAVELEALKSWLVRTLEDTGIARVIVKSHPGGENERYDLRALGLYGPLEYRTRQLQPVPGRGKRAMPGRPSPTVSPAEGTAPSLDQVRGRSPIR